MGLLKPIIMGMSGYFILDFIKDTNNKLNLPLVKEETSKELKSYINKRLDYFIILIMCMLDYFITV